MEQEISLSDALNYLLLRLTQSELAEKIGLDQWKMLGKMKDSSFTDDEKEKIKLIFSDLSNKPKNEAKKIVDKFYNNSNFLTKINQQNRLLLAKTSAIIHVERFACMCSSGLEALSCPFSTKFLRSTDLRFTTSPAIATYTLLVFKVCFRWIFEFWLIRYFI
jgi:hypothetical protein